MLRTCTKKQQFPYVGRIGCPCPVHTLCFDTPSWDYLIKAFTLPIEGTSTPIFPIPLLHQPDFPAAPPQGTYPSQGGSCERTGFAMLRHAPGSGSGSVAGCEHPSPFTEIRGEKKILKNCRDFCWHTHAHSVGTTMTEPEVPSICFSVEDKK